MRRSARSGCRVADREARTGPVAPWFFAGLAASATIALVLPSPAQAYIDASAGSILLQLVLGGVAGILVIVKLYYRRLMTFLGRQPSDPDPASDVSPD